MKLLAPLAAVFGFVSSVFTKLSDRFFPREEEPSVTEEELYDIIDTIEEEGVMDEEQGDLIKSALDFSGTRAADVMTMREDITAADAGLPNEELLAVLRESTHSRLPVYEGDVDHIIGLIHIRVFVREYLKNPKIDIRSLLTPAYRVSPDARIDDLLSVMRQHKLYLAIVADGEGKTLGLVTIEDFLEELVGEIWDESDEIVEECVRTGENTYEVNGDMNIDDFFAEIGFEPRDFECEYSTVGGWAIERLEADPHVGDSFSFRDIPLEDGEEPDGDEPVTTLTVVVSAMGDMRVTKLTVLVSKSASEDGEKEE
jgi:CBS domain containing-hemolysin-like protein